MRDRPSELILTVGQQVAFQPIHSVQLLPVEQQAGGVDRFVTDDHRSRVGEYETGEYKRIGKGGKEVWLQSSYNAILDRNGKPLKVVKYAADITEEKRTYLKRTIAAKKRD